MISHFHPTNHIFRSSIFQQVVSEVIEFALTTPAQPLPPPKAFEGAGIYLLYYTGAFPPYDLVAQSNRRALSMPIYAGKAVPSGWRQARSATSASSALYRRLKEHAFSIKAAENLEVVDFQCRFAILEGEESSLITAVEAATIRRYRPLWNSVIDGFGNHDPGINRYGQILAGWDTLHPGRSWEKKWQGRRPDYTKLVESIRNHFG
ncbi:MAG: Eco29kI family restriction endonuclease [Synechococcales bacterium]|nr:Eco29kI family restriction endonuclease [Synechococcales bacterium]